MTDRPDRMRWLIAGACLILAPLGEVIEALLSPLGEHSTPADISGIAHHQGAFVASVLIGLAATVLYVPAFLALGRLGRERSPRLAPVGAALGVVAMLGFAGIRMGQGAELQLVREGLPAQRAAALADHLGTNPIGAAFILMLLGGSLLGAIVLGVVLWRSGRVPRTAVALFVAFPIVDLGIHGHAGAVIAHAVMLAGLGTIGWLVLARREQVWEGRPAVARRAGVPATAL